MAKVSKKKRTKEKKKHVPPKRGYFWLYQVFVLMASLLAIILYSFNWFTSEALGISSERMMGIPSVLKSASLIIFYSELYLAVVCVLAIFIYSICSRHSVIWALGKLCIPVVAPLGVFLWFRLLSGDLYNALSEVIIGVVSGIISSVIVVVLDRKHSLANKVLKYAAPEYLEEDDKQNPQ